MAKYTRNEARVALYIIRFGLHCEPDDLIRKEKLEILRVVDQLVNDGHDVKALLEAAKHGMGNVWPFSEGQSWDAKDFRDNVTKAKAEAGRLKKKGRMPKLSEEVLN